MAMLCMASRKRRGIDASASATRRSNCCAVHGRRPRASMRAFGARSAQDHACDSSRSRRAPRTGRRAASACRSGGRAGSACRRSGSSAPAAARRTAAARRLRDRPTRRCRSGSPRAARADRPAARGRRARDRGRRWPSSGRRRAARPAPSMSAGTSPRDARRAPAPCRSATSTSRGRSRSNESAARARRASRLRERARVRIALEQRRRHHVDALIGGLRGQDRRHQQLERRCDSAARCRRPDAASRAVEDRARLAWRFHRRCLSHGRAISRLKSVNRPVPLFQPTLL